jgi:serine/threonine protein kinase
MGVLSDEDSPSCRSLDYVVLATHGVRGVTFPNVVGNGQLSVQCWLDCCMGMLDVIEKLHARRIVHGDIKPANFCQSKHGKCMLAIDFGVHPCCGICFSCVCVSA